MSELAEWALGYEPYDAAVFRDRPTAIEDAAPTVRAVLHEHLPGVNELAALIMDGTR